MSDSKTETKVDTLSFLKDAPTVEETWNKCDFTSLDNIHVLFPRYVQEQYNYAKINGTKKPPSKHVELQAYTLRTPNAAKVLLDDVDITIEPNKRTVLYGENSTGKTLLFHSIAHGQIKDFPKHIHVHHCQELELHELDDTVLGTVVHSNGYLNMLLRVEKKLKELLAEADLAADQKTKLEFNLEHVVTAINRLNGYDSVEKAQKMLRVLGFDDEGMKKKCSALSGGLRMRVALCMAFFIDADLLLLDEPTNHLDFPSVLWLENRLRSYRNAFLIVSHDRQLLNNVCTSVLVIEDKKIKPYAMGFEQFEKTKAKEDAKKADEIDKFLEKNRNADPSTLAGKLRYEKLQWRDAYQAKMVALAGKFTFPASTPLENKELDANGQPYTTDKIPLIKMENLRFSYNPEAGHFIFNDPISFTVTASTRVGVMGPNGAGKSTFLKLLTFKLTPTDGKVTHHPNFRTAYFGQHSTAELDMEMTPIEFMEKSFPKANMGQLRGHLAKTGVTETADARMKALSYSQRSCVIFAKLTFTPPHLLIMDEPTNFLDLPSVDSLITACNKYKGALLLVSHNRDFLRKCANEYLSICPGQFALFKGLKEAERATYTFIQEMEEGGSVKTKDMLVNNPGGGSVAASQRVGADGKPINPTPASATGAKPAESKTAAPSFAVGENVIAKWTDGKLYPAVVKKVEAGKFTVFYTGYGNTAVVTAASLQKAPAAAAGAAAKPGAKPAAGAAAAKPGAKAPATGRR